MHPPGTARAAVAQRVAGTWSTSHRKQGAELGLEPRAPPLLAGCSGHVVWALAASAT